MQIFLTFITKFGFVYKVYHLHGRFLYILRIFKLLTFKYTTCSIILHRILFCYLYCHRSQKSTIVFPGRGVPETLQKLDSLKMSHKFYLSSRGDASLRYQSPTYRPPSKRTFYTTDFTCRSVPSTRHQESMALPVVTFYFTGHARRRTFVFYWFSYVRIMLYRITWVSYIFYSLT